MKKLIMLLVAAMGVSTLFAKCACPGDKLTGAPSWAPAPLKALTFETGGDAKWTTDNVESNSVGVAGKVLRSGAIKANQSSWAQVRVKGAGQLSFSWKVSSQEGGDKLVVDVCRACTDPEHCKCCKGYSEDDCSCAGCKDKQLIAHIGQPGDQWYFTHDAISGLDGEWETVTIQFQDNDTRFEGDGSKTNLIEHIVRWTYVKNEALNRGEDCGWLDNVTWASAGGDLQAYERWEQYGDHFELADKWLSGPGETIAVTFDTNGGQYTNELESAFTKVSEGVYKRSDFKFAYKYGYTGTGPAYWTGLDFNRNAYYSAYSTNFMTNEVGQVTNCTQVITQFPTNEIVREGYEFVGWYTSKDDLWNLGEHVCGRGYGDNGNADVVSPTNITVYARWRQIESDKGLDLFTGLGFDAMKDGAQKTCIAETLTTNHWIACAKGGVDGGKMAMNLPDDSSNFFFTITNDTGTATGTDGVLSFDWRVTEDSLDVQEYSHKYGWWVTEAYTTNAVGEYVVKVDGFKPRFVTPTDPADDFDPEYDSNTLWRSSNVEKDEDYDAGIWKYAEVGTYRADPDETREIPLYWDDNKYMTTNAVKRVMTRHFQVRYTQDDDPEQAAQIANMTWTPVPAVNVVFDANGGKVEGKATYEKTYAPGYTFDYDNADSNLVSSAFITNTIAGAQFAGWWTEKEFNAGNEINGWPLPCTNGVVTLFAHWLIPVADAIGQPKLDITDSTCCDPEAGWVGKVGGPSNVVSAAWCGFDPGESHWFETTVTLTDGGLMSFKWFMSLSGSITSDLFTFYVDGIEQVRKGEQYPWSKPRPGEYDDWDTFYYYLTSGQHTLKWTYAENDGQQATTGYVTDLRLDKADAKNLVEWLHVLHAYDAWLTNKLDKFAAAYEKNFTNAKADEAARARFGHAVCTILGLSENAKVIEALHDVGSVVEFQPYICSNLFYFASGDYASKAVLEHLESIKDMTDNDRYMKFANEAIAAYKAAIADLDAIPADWKGSFKIAATGYQLDATGTAYTNDVAVDIADINMVKANFNGMLSQIQFVGAHDMTLDHDVVLSTMTNRPAITRTPKMNLESMVGPYLLKLNEENVGITEEQRGLNKASILKSFGDGSDWDIVPEIPLKSAPYAEFEQSGSARIAMCGGKAITDYSFWSDPTSSRNANRLYFRFDANTLEKHWFDDKTIVATFVDEMNDSTVTLEVPFWSYVNDSEIVEGLDGCWEADLNSVRIVSNRVKGDYRDWESISKARACFVDNKVVVEVDLGSAEYGDYYPLHWTIFSVQVVGSDSYFLDRDLIVGEHKAPTMTGNSNDWKRVKTYAVSGGIEAEALQCVRSGTNVYVRLIGLDPETEHTFESLHVTANAKFSDDHEIDLDYDIDTEKVVFTGNDVEICFALHKDFMDYVTDYDAFIKVLCISDIYCSCCDDDDQDWAEYGSWVLEFNADAWAYGELSDEMRWHSVLTHYDDITAVLKEQPEFLKKLKDKAMLVESKETMRAALTSYLAADNAIESRKEDVPHLYWHGEEQKAEITELHAVVSNALAALDAPQKVNFALLSKVLGNIREAFEDKYLPGPGFETFIPAAMRSALNTLKIAFDGDVSIDLGMLFENGLSRNFLPQFDGCWPVLDTIPDVTYGGLFPEMTLGEWLGSYMGRGIISLDTYNEIYPRMTTKVPSQLKVRQYVNGEGYVTFTTDLREAMPSAHISCAVDGIDQAVTEFAPSHVSSGVWVKGKGEHEIVWTIVSTSPWEEVVYYGEDCRDVSYGLFWDFSRSSGWQYWPGDVQHNNVIPLKNVVFSDGLKLIAKRRSGGSVDFGFDDDTPFVAGAAQTFQGELLSEGKVAGSVTVKVDKKGVVSATVNRMDGTKESFKKGTLNAEGVVEFEGGLTLTLGTNKLSGSLGEDLEIAGVRNVFASKDAADKDKAADAMTKWQNTYVFAMEAINPEEAGPFVNGYGVFTLTVGKNGKSKLAGFMPDGTKVSYSTQLLLGEKDAHVPVSVPLYKKAGGIGMDIVLGEESSLSVAGVSGWKMSAGAVADWMLAASGVASVSEPLPGPHEFHMTEAFAFEMDCCEAALPTEIRPEIVSVGSNGKWSFEKAAKVTNAGGEWAIDDSKGTNLSGLKLSYKASTGLYKGTFVVYALEGGKVKKYKATVNGAEIDGVGYGSAVIKDKGAAPVTMYLMSED